MLQTSTRHARATNLASFVAICFVVALSLFTPDAHAQLAAATSKFTALQVGLLAISVTIATLAFIFVGVRMMFQAARFADVSHVVIGAVIIASSTLLAAWAVA